MISFDNRNLERTLISSHRDGEVLDGNNYADKPTVWLQCARVPSLTIWLQSGEWLIGNSLPYHLELGSEWFMISQFIMLSLVPQGDPQGLPPLLCYFKDIWQPSLTQLPQSTLCWKVCWNRERLFQKKTNKQKKKVPVVMNCSHSWNHWNIPGDENKDFLLLLLHPIEEALASPVSTPELWQECYRETRAKDH